jgi:hypothetical protein
MVEHGEGRRISAQPGSDRISGPDRHLAAVTRSLGWAQESADRGDYADALGWVQVVEATGDLFSTAQRATHQVWRDALADNLARQGRS